MGVTLRWSVVLLFVVLFFLVKLKLYGTSTAVCVEAFTSNRSLYPTMSVHPVSVMILHPRTQRDTDYVVTDCRLCESKQSNRIVCMKYVFISVCMYVCMYAYDENGLAAGRINTTY